MKKATRNSVVVMGAGMVGVAASAQAAIHEFDTGGFTGPQIQFNLQTGAVFSDFSGAYDFSLSATSNTTADIKTGDPKTTETYLFQGNGASNHALDGVSSNVGRMNYGAVIDATGDFSGSDGVFYNQQGGSLPPPPTEWTDTDPGNRGFVGFKFDISGTNHYGWADVTVNNDVTFSLNRIAYEDQPDVAVLAGVPEPSMTGALVAGAAGVAVLLRRRQLAKR